MIKNYWNKGSKQKKRVVLFCSILLLLLFFLRDDYQPALLFLRKFIFIILACFSILFFWFRGFRKSASVLKKNRNFSFRNFLFRNCILCWLEFKFLRVYENLQCF